MIEKEQLKPCYDAVIIGAGAAGIAAAKTLIQQGHTNILVVEARDRIGGRLDTHPIYQDLGAAWSHINDARLNHDGEKFAKLEDIDWDILRAAQKRNFTLSLDRQDSHIYWNGERISREKMFSYLDAAFDEMKEIVTKYGDMTVAEAFKLFKHQDAFMKWVLRMDFGWGSSGRDIESVSVLASLKHLSCASGVLYKEGLGNLMQELGEEIKPYTMLNTQVKAIRTTDTPFSEIEVQTADGEKRLIRAGQVLSTIPPSVFNHKGDEFEIQHNFPAWKTNAFEKLPSGAMNKIVFELEPGYLEAKQVADNRHYEVLQNELGNIYFLARPSGHNVLVGFVGGDTSIALEKLGADAAAAYAQHFLSTVPEFKDISSHIKSIYFTNWYKDPYARGSYSTPVVGAGDAREKLRTPIDDKIFFAGEACSFDGWETHSYGAYETGKQAAYEMLDKEKSKHNIFLNDIPKSQNAGDWTALIAQEKMNKQIKILSK